MYSYTETGNTKRSRLSQLYQTNPTFFKLAATFISVSVLLSVILIAVMAMLKDKYDNYDYSRIEKEGLLVEGVITDLEVTYSTTINSRHPLTISYTYDSSGKQVADRFKTLPQAGPVPFRIGDVIDIKVLNNQSKVAGLEAFRFPFYIFFVIPLVFFCVGLGFIIRLVILNKRKTADVDRVYQSR